MILQTERLALRQAELADGPFIFELLTDKTFIDNIADKGVRELSDAEDYIRQSLLASYENNGFGLYLVERKSDNAAVGLCGLVKRDGLNCPDIGYAFLPRFTGVGFATESAKAVFQYAQNTLKLTRVVGITSPDNTASIAVLKKIGLGHQQQIELDGKPTVLLY